MNNDNKEIMIAIIICYGFMITFFFIRSEKESIEKKIIENREILEQTQKEIAEIKQLLKRINDE